MCGTYSWQIGMDNTQQLGDLGDIVRARGSAAAAAAASGAGNRVFDEACGLPPEQLGSFQPAAAGRPIGDCGDSFSSFRDPLLHELAAGAMLLDSPKSADVGLMIITPAGSDGGGAMLGCGGSLMSQKIVVAGDEMNKGPSSIISKASPMVSPRRIRPCTVLNGDMVKVINSSMAARPPEEGGLQIPSAARIPGIKRRKGQAKKVVCIPAPAAASSKPGGEVVPPDLWAWRKYGQKPIKGSPYPRGYYRCSSSKGCSARKQVERSRTDHNMLVITYTSEHNHPWPTQRNALAGSTRSSQPAKNTSSAPAKSSPHNQRSPASCEKYESNETAAMPTMDSPSVKEVGLLTATDGEHIDEQNQLFHWSYEPVPPLEPTDTSVDDLFAGLGELESDPMSLLFSTHWVGAKPAEEGRDQDNAVDPFSMLEWGANLLGETRKGSCNKALERGPDS